MYERTLDTFLAVAKSGSFTKAAGHLYITHTAVIKQINALEVQLGVKLFQRSNQGVVMTSAGQCLYEEAPKFIQISQNMIRKVRNAWLVSPQTIRIGTSNL
jgi:DNA-binding transcriptional LysR family regulator